MAHAGTYLVSRSVPHLAYAFAAWISFVLAGVVIVAFLQLGPSPTTTYVVPYIVSAVAALTFALKWSRGSWRWGIVFRCSFWVFLFIVFLSYLSVSQHDWLLAVRALPVLLAGMAGAGFATYLRTTYRLH